MSHCCSRGDWSRTASVFGNGTTEQLIIIAPARRATTDRGIGRTRFGDARSIPLAQFLESRIERIPPHSEDPVRLFHLDPAKRDPLARLHLTDASDVERADRGDLRVASGRLTIDQQHDRLAVTDHLDAAEGDTVGDDVMAVRVLDPRPAQART